MTPKTASSKEISTSNLKSSPACGAFGSGLPPNPNPPKPPKNELNISFKSPKPLAKGPFVLNPALARPTSPYWS